MGHAPERETIMGMFTGVEGASETGSYRYLVPGTWQLEITKVSANQTRHGEAFFAVDCKVIETTAEDYPPGSAVSWMVMKKHDAFLSNVKKFIAVAAGADFDEVSEDDCEAVIGEDQPLTGKVLYAIAHNKTTKAGKPFTVVEWKTSL